MKYFAFLLLFTALNAQAAFLLNYGLNYSSQNDASSTSKYEQSRIFNKGFIGASVNGGKTLFFGWNINSWSTDLTIPNNNSTYSLLEMGPRLIWFTNENYNLYFSTEWNPYAKGSREKGGTSRDIQAGSSISFAVGYRFRLNKMLGFGAGIHYHALGIKEEKVGSATNQVSDNITNIMPMLELSLAIR
jgi:hypothetical protein